MKLTPHHLAGTIALLANATDTLTLAVGGSDVIIWGIGSKATGAFKLNVTPSDTNKSLASELCDSSILSGDAKQPFRIDNEGNPSFFERMRRLVRGRSAPLLVTRGSNISIDVTDTSGSANTIQIVLYGYRIE